jgi:hypothetical protein
VSTAGELLQYLEAAEKLAFFTHGKATPDRLYATVMVAFFGQYSTQEIAGE